VIGGFAAGEQIVGRSCLLSWIVAVFAAFFMMSGPVSAQMGGNNVQVAGRVASFLQPPPAGRIQVAIVYDPGDPASENEARSIERSLGAGLVIGNMLLKPKRVASNSLHGLAGTRVAFVTRGTDYRAIAFAAAARSILTISSDPACAQAGFCTVTISSTPRVQITVSRAATRAAKLKFSAAFLMLIKEI
jgi:hypothetical protein